MNRTLRITTFLVALVVLAIAAPLAQADPPQIEQYATSSAATSGSSAGQDRSSWQPFFLGGSDEAATSLENRRGYVASSGNSVQSSTELNLSGVGYGFGAGLLLAVLVGGAVVMSGRARRGGLAHS